MVLQVLQSARALAPTTRDKHERLRGAAVQRQLHNTLLVD
jgi:hypothetical protein